MESKEGKKELIIDCPHDSESEHSYPFGEEDGDVGVITEWKCKQCGRVRTRIEHDEDFTSTTSESSTHSSFFEDHFKQRCLKCGREFCTSDVLGCCGQRCIRDGEDEDQYYKEQKNRREYEVEKQRKITEALILSCKDDSFEKQNCRIFKKEEDDVSDSEEDLEETPGDDPKVGQIKEVEPDCLHLDLYADSGYGYKRCPDCLKILKVLCCKKCYKKVSEICNCTQTTKPIDCIECVREQSNYMAFDRQKRNIRHSVYIEMAKHMLSRMETDLQTDEINFIVNSTKHRHYKP